MMMRKNSHFQNGLMGPSPNELYPAEAEEDGGEVRLVKKFLTWELEACLLSLSLARRWGS